MTQTLDAPAVPRTDAPAALVDLTQAQRAALTRFCGGKRIVALYEGVQVRQPAVPGYLDPYTGQRSPGRDAGPARPVVEVIFARPSGSVCATRYEYTTAAEFLDVVARWAAKHR